MKSKAIISFVLAFLFVTILTPLGQTEASTSRVAIISEFKGTVEVKKSGGKKKLKAFKKMSLNQGDEVTTGDDSTVTLKFSNGTDEDDTLMLDKNTTVTFSKVSNKQGTVTKVTMKKGNAWVDVKSIKNKSDEFTLETPTAVMGVRGTHFMVSIDPSTGLPTLFVSSGKVAVNPSQSPSSPNSEAGSAPPITIFPGTQLTLFPSDSELNPNDMINMLDIDQFINSVSPDIIAAILKNKESIDKENEELIASLFEGAGYTGLDFSDAAQFENYKNNLEILLQHILKSAANSGKVSEQQLQQIVDEANRSISDAKRQLDLQRTPPPLSTNAGIEPTESERRMKQQEEARIKKAQQEEEKRQQQQKRQQELLAEIQRQKELIEQQNKKAAEEAKKRAEDQLMQSLNDAQKQALEERMRQRELEDRPPAPTPTPPAPTTAPPRPTPEPPVEHEIPEGWEISEDIFTMNLISDSNEYPIGLSSGNNVGLYSSDIFFVKQGSTIWTKVNLESEFKIIEASVNGVIYEEGISSENEISFTYVPTPRENEVGDTLKLTLERTTNEGKESGTITFELNYIAEPENVFDIEVVTDIELIQLRYNQRYKPYAQYDFPMFELFEFTPKSSEEDDENGEVEFGNNPQYKITSSPHYMIEFVKSVVQGEPSVDELEPTDNVYQLEMGEYLIKVKKLNVTESDIPEFYLFQLYL